MSDLSADRWRRISSLFDEVVKLPPEDRAAFLVETCGEDEDLKSRVLALLEATERAPGFLDGPVPPGAGSLRRQIADRMDLPPDPPASDDLATATTRSLAPAGASSEQIGPYRLLHKVGEGGMGEVWLAEQTEPILRRVALKVIKAGLDTKQVVARFEAERQALALMDHPGIAKVYEAGETPRGLPYFAMEYIKGEPITRYCDRHRLGAPERLELFALVCEAVQHAHQKGVIHRDIKPSNVLVSIVGEKPQPKVIDFGVAKSTAQRLTEKTMFTELRVLIGTPEYMSPEQAEMTGLDVDTRTDVYALGVMLYELLTGALPFEPKELRAAGFEEIRRRIREVEPPRPSTRVKSLGEQSAEAAKNRRTDPGRLISRLKGDLDWIVMKALEKDRTRRYGTPSELSADLQRHLKHEPVLAGPPSAAYRARKFVRRHRFGVAAAGLSVIGLVAFGVMMTLQARTIARERDRAERVSKFLVELFRVSDPSEARGNSITAREVLDRGAQRIDKELGDEPLVQAQMMLTMGWVYINLGLPAKAEPLLHRSVEIRRRLLGPDDPRTLAALHGEARAVMDRGRYAEAEALYRSVLEGRRRVLGSAHADTISSMNALAVVFERQGRLKEAGEVYPEALGLALRVLGEDHDETIWLKHNIAVIDQSEGRHAEAKKALREVYEKRRDTKGEDHPDTIWALDSLAGLHDEQGRHDEAERLYRHELDLVRRVYGPDSPDAGSAMGSLAVVLINLGRFEEAEKLTLESNEITRRSLGDEHPGTLVGMHNLASVYMKQGKYDEAEKVFTDTLAILRRVMGDEHPNVLAAMNNLAALQGRKGRHDLAVKLYTEVLAIQHRLLGEEHPDSLRTMTSLAGAHARQGRHDLAEKIFLETIEKERRVLGETNTITLDTTYRMGCAQVLRGNRAKALDLLRQSVEGGYGEADKIAQNPDCQSLRGDAEFEGLVAKSRDNARRGGS